MSEGKQIDPIKLFISYEPVLSETFTGPDNKPLVLGFIPTICAGVSPTNHMVIYRLRGGEIAPSPNGWETPHDAMDHLAQSFPVLGCGYDKPIWKYLPGDKQPSFTDPCWDADNEGHTIFLFPYFEGHEAMVQAYKAIEHDQVMQRIRSIF